MKYFVTGATGFIGGRLARRLREMGHEVVALVREHLKPFQLWRERESVSDGALHLDLNGVIVEQRAHIEQSCLGPRTFVSKNSTVSACVAFGAMHWDMHAWQVDIKSRNARDPKLSFSSDFQFRWVLGAPDVGTIYITYCPADQ